MSAPDLRTATLFVAPAVLLLGFVYHPYVANSTDDAAIAAAAAEDTTRWGLAHVVIGIGYALMALAFVALRSYLHGTGENRWSAIALPFAVLGSCLLIPLTGMELALVGVAETGGDLEAVQEELMPWFIPFLITGGLGTAIGAVAFAAAVARSSVFPPTTTRIVVASLIVMALARFVPLGIAQIVVGIAAVGALWPIGYSVWSKADERTADGVVTAPRAGPGS